MICKRCNGEYKRNKHNGHDKGLCGSVTLKTGCLWQERVEKQREWSNSYHYRKVHGLKADPFMYKLTKPTEERIDDGIKHQKMDFSYLNIKH